MRRSPARGSRQPVTFGKSAAEPTASTPAPVTEQSVLQTWRELAGIAWPIMLSGLVTLVISSNDSVLLAHASPRVLASVIAASSIHAIAAMSVSGLVSAAQILISRATGAGRRDHAARASEAALWLGLWVGTAAAVLVTAIGPLVLAVLSGPAVDAGFARAYLFITVLALPFTGLTGAMRARVSGLGATRGLLVASITAAAVDVAASLILNALIGPFGVAVGTVLGTASGAAVFAVLIARSRRPAGAGLFVPAPRLRSLLIAHPAQVRQLLGLGWPEAIFFAASAGSGLVVTFLLAPFSPTALSASRFLEIAASMVVFTILVSISTASLTLLGRAAGAEAPDQWAMVWRRTAAFTLTIAALITVTGPLILPPLLRVIAGEEIAAAAQTVVWLAFAQTLFMALQVALVAGLRSLKDTRGPMLAGLIAEYVVFLPLGWYLTRHLELELLGVFLTHIAYWLAALAVCSSRLRPAFRRWQAELTAGTPPPLSKGP